MRRGPARAFADTLIAELPDEHRAALRRCAVMAVFDEDVYDAALRPGPVPDLAELAGSGLVERLPGGDDLCRVQPALQEAAWTSWFGPDHDAEPGDGPAPAALRAVAAEVARFCAEHHRDVEQLRALLLVDQAAAEACFDAAFTRHDERFDLAGCENLLNVLTEPARSPFVGPALAARHDDLRRYLTARDMWRSAYLGTDPARYLARAELQSTLETVLAGDGPQLIRLRGATGLGKSTLLRWLLARRCVPARVPCALVDLDALDPVNATRHPWLLVLEVARQLDGQMFGKPFQTLLRDHELYLAVLSAQVPTGVHAGSTALGTATGDVDADEITSRFFDALRDAGSPRVVLVLDTVEEALLRPANETVTLMALLRRLLTDDPGIRLVVSGKATAARPDLVVTYLSDAVVLDVPPFTAAQSTEYLRSVRHLPDAAVVDAVVAVACGLPGQLTVWGDVVEQYPSLTPVTLRAIQPEVTWVVDRIIGRIGNVVVRWLVRYGVVPRTLHRDVAEQVLLPRIARALAGCPDDDPNRDARPHETPVFRTDATVPSGGLEFADLWNQLTRYAATTSWLRLAPGDDAVVFHPDVRGPMRTLIAAQPVSALLHDDAVRYYTDLAPRDPARWASWTCEAIYHRFQRDGQPAARHWRAAVAQARRTGLSGDTIAQIAVEVLGPDYVDEDGRPRTLPSGAPVIDARTLAAAHVEQAWAQCRIALRDDVPSGHPAWSQVESSLASAARCGGDPESDVRRRAAQAALDLVRGAPATAVDLLRSVVAEDGGSAVDRCIALMLLARALLASGHHTQARQTLLAAAEVADGLAEHDMTATVARALADGAVRLGRIDEALDGLEHTLRRHHDLAGNPGLRRTRARCALLIGRPANSLQIVFHDSPGPDLGQAQAEAEIALGDPAGAALTCATLLAGTLEREQLAAVLALRGRANAQLLRVDQALDDLVRAREVHIEIGDTEGAGSATALAAEVLLHDVGNLREAQQYLDEGARLTLEPASPAWARCRLLRAELDVRREEPTEADRSAREALDTVASLSNDPRQIVDVALAAYCWSPTLETQVIALLSEHLPRIGPDTARLTALSALASCPRWRWGRHLLKLTLPTGQTWESDTPEDAAWLNLRTAELMRVAGRSTEAVALADVATTALAGRSPLAGWIWLQAAQRAAPRGAVEHPATLAIPDSAAFPLLAAAQGIVLAERWLAAGNRAGAQQLIAAAAAALSDATPRTTWWHGRLAVLRRRLADPEQSTASTVRQSLVVTATRRELGYAAEPDSAELEEPAVVAEPERAWTAALDSSGDLVLSTDRTRTTVPATHPLVASLHEENRTTGKAALVRWVRGRMRDGDLLPLDEVLPPIGPAESVDLRLSAAPPLAQLPWELATLDGLRLVDHPGVGTLQRAPDPGVSMRVRVRLLQEALAAAGCSPGATDGLHGPDTARALVLFQTRAGIRSDGAAGPETWRALRSSAGIGPRTVLMLRYDAVPEREDAYTRLGWTVRSLRSEELPDIELAVAPGPVDVVHVTASMHVAGAIPYLYFGSGTGTTARFRSESVTCGVLDAAVRRLAKQGSTPLVVLDVADRPYFDSETVRQLLLRNDFAQQLLALGHCYAVLATGLAPQAQATAARQRLLTELTTATTAADLSGSLRSDLVEGPDPGDLFPWATTALFTAVPPNQLPPLHRSGGTG